MGAAGPGMWACSDALTGWLGADGICRQKSELRPDVEPVSEMCLTSPAETVGKHGRCLASLINWHLSANQQLKSQCLSCILLRSDRTVGCVLSVSLFSITTWDSSIHLKANNVNVSQGQNPSIAPDSWTSQMILPLKFSQS